MAERKKHPGGRPPVPLDPRQVEELARIGCTEADMAAVLGVSVDTIQRRKRSCAEFCGVIEKGQASLRNSLRRLQVKKALEGNVTMLIWLGKQLLGQSDRQGIEHSGGREPVRIVEVTCDAELSRMTTEELQARLAQLQEQGVLEAEDRASLPSAQPQEWP
jgi:hypothetical protein